MPSARPGSRWWRPPLTRGGPLAASPSPRSRALPPTSAPSTPARTAGAATPPRTPGPALASPGLAPFLGVGGWQQATREHTATARGKRSGCGPPLREGAALRECRAAAARASRERRAEVTGPAQQRAPPQRTRYPHRAARVPEQSTIAAAGTARSTHLRLAGRELRPPAGRCLSTWGGGGGSQLRVGP